MSTFPTLASAVAPLPPTCVVLMGASLGVVPDHHDRAATVASHRWTSLVRPPGPAPARARTTRNGARSGPGRVVVARSGRDDADRLPPGSERWPADGGDVPAGGGLRRARLRGTPGPTSTAATWSSRRPAAEPRSNGPSRRPSSRPSASRSRRSCAPRRSSTRPCTSTPSRLADGDTYFITFLKEVPPRRHGQGPGGGLERLRHPRRATVERSTGGCRGRSTETTLKKATWNLVGEHGSTSRNVTMLRKLQAKLDG